MAFEWVKDALLTHYSKGVADLLPVTAWKNLTFDPSGLNLWLKVFYVPVTEDPATLGIHGDNEFNGLLQISVYQKVDTGTSESDAVINRLNTLFAIPQRLECPSGCMLRLTSKQASQGGQTSLADFSAGGTEGVWDTNYLTIYWLAREPRRGN